MSGSKERHAPKGRNLRDGKHNRVLRQSPASPTAETELRLQRLRKAASLGWRAVVQRYGLTTIRYAAQKGGTVLYLERGSEWMSKIARNGWDRLTPAERKKRVLRCRQDLARARQVLSERKESK